MTDGLSDIRVLELGAGIAPAYSGWLLASSGADVTKLAEPGDRTRRQARGLLFDALNRGKRVQLRGPVSETDLRQALDGTNVMVESLAWPDYERLQPVFASFVAAGGIVASISCYGRSGPYRARRGFSLQAVAASVAYRMGSPDRAPLTFPLEAADYVGGVAVTAGVLLALRVRAAGGPGQQIDVAVADVLSNLFNRNGVGQAAAGGPARGQRHGDRWPQVYPGGVLPCADGLVSFVTLLTKHWDRYAEAIGRGDLLMLPRYNVRNGPLPEDVRAELDAIQIAWLQDRTRAELFAFFQQIRVPFQPVHSVREVLDAPHLAERGFWAPLGSERGEIRVPAAPARRIAHEGM